MPYYLCRLASEDGRVLTQSILAASPQECRKYFESEGYFVLSIARDWKKIKLHTIPFGRKIKDKDFILFNQELMAMIRSGYPILRSLEVIAGRAKNVYLKELLGKVESDVKAGKSLSEAFAPHENRFSKVYTASLMAGERSGNLSGTLSRYILYAKIISQTRSKIRSAMMYPTLLLAFSLVLMGVLVNFILPRFSTFYADFEAKLPAVTRALMAFSLAARKNFLWILLFIGVAAAVFYQMTRQEKTKVAIDKTKLKLPYVRAMWTESGVSLFSRTLGLLLEAGISLLTAIPIASQAVPNKFLIRKMKDVPDFIKNGEGLTESLSKAEFFPPLALDMIRIGETSANLQGMLAEVADFYDERIRAKIDTLVSLIEPVIIIFMGLIVAGMLLAVYLPIFNIIRIAR